VLQAREVDEKTVQINKMVDQLTNLVMAQESNVGALFEHWVEDR
jgi:hypothetical protein